MGTGGYFVFVFRGRFLTYYNMYDPYLEGLGNRIANKIPTDTSKYIGEALSTTRSAKCLRLAVTLLAQ